MPLLALLFVAQYVADPLAVLGRSRRVRTHDGVRDLAALTGSPLRWSHRKRFYLQNYRGIDRAIDDLVSTHARPIIVCDGWLPHAIVFHRLQMIDDSGQPPVVVGPKAREARFGVGTRHVTTLSIRSKHGQTLTPSMMQLQDLGSGSRILLLSNRTSLKALPPEAVTTRIVRGRISAWVVELP